MLESLLCKQIVMGGSRQEEVVAGGTADLMGRLVGQERF